MALDPSSPHRFTEVTSQSWLSRIGGAIGGVIVGLILFVAAFPMLFWNEGRAVRRHRALEEGAAVVTSVDSAAVDPGNAGRLVHVTGTAATEEVLTDPEFGITAAALKLRRAVEMYQWRETSHSEERNKLGGGTETVTVYEYELVWEDRLIDSSDFRRPGGHENPATMPYSSRQFVANRVTLDAFALAPSQVGRIGNFEDIVLGGDAEVPTALADRATVANGGFYVGTPGSPQVGDLRVRFAAVEPGPVSVIAAQVGNSFEAYRTDNDGSIELVAVGTRSAESMFESAMTQNTITTWVLRLAGLLIMFFGLSMIFRPLSVIADVVPILGNIVAAGVGMVAFLIALVFSLATIAVAWLVYRPLLGATLLAIAVAVIWLLRSRLRGSKPQAAAA